MITLGSPRLNIGQSLVPLLRNFERCAEMESEHALFLQESENMIDIGP